MVTGASTKLPLSGVVIAKNEGDRIGRCVASLAAICSEVIVLDSGSSDDTVVLATAAGARVEQQPWLGFAAQKNAAIARASQPWVLLLDADEWLDADDLPKLRALFARGEVERADVWRLPRCTRNSTCRAVASPASMSGSNTTPRARTTNTRPSCTVMRGCGRNSAMTRASAPAHGRRHCTRPPTG